MELKDATLLFNSRKGEKEMNLDRKVPGWIAVVTGGCGCAPLACISGVMAAIGTITASNSTYGWEKFDTTLLTIFICTALTALVVGGLLLALGVWLLVSAKKSGSPSDSTSQD
jgi:uncharacterized membrane protein